MLKCRTLSTLKQSCKNKAITNSLATKNKNIMKTLSELQFEKQILLDKFNALTENHKRLYSNMDIEQPKSESEKQSEKVNSDLFSQINEIVIQIRKLKIADK